MRMTALPLVLAAAVLGPAGPALAQKPTAQKPAARKPAAKPPAPAAEPADDAERARQRRETAVYLLVSVAEEAKQFRDDAARARVQARAADALWEVDRDRAVPLFRRAFEAADAADREARRRKAEEMAASKSSRRVFTGVSEVRPEIIRLAATRDRALGEELLSKLSASVSMEGEQANTFPENSPFHTPDAVEKRIQLAADLLRAGETARAVQFAEPALAAVSVPAISFLADLRAKDAASADEYYAALLARAAADPASDANTVSALASYVISPNVFVAVSPTGSTNTMQRGPRGKAPDLPDALRQAFFQAAARVLLRPAEALAASPTGAGGTYLIMGRLMPFFEAQAPLFVPQLRARMSELAAQAPENVRSPDHGALRSGLEEDSEESASAHVADALARARDAKSADERDGAYAAAAMHASESGDPRARDFLDEVENADLRRAIRGYLDFNTVSRALRAQDWEAALRAARTGELTNAQRVWALTLAAENLAKTDRERAAQIVGEAADFAGRIDAADADRPRAFLAAAKAATVADPARAPELASEAAKSAARTPDFTGEDGNVRVMLQTPTMSSINTESAENFDIEPTFRALGKADLEGAMLVAKAFPEGPRATALIAIARGVLAGK